MNKKERVLAAIAGDPVDRTPFSLWLHNFARENTAQELRDETVELYEAFDWDFLKPQSRPMCFAQMWGLCIEPSTQRAVWPTTTYFPVQNAKDFASLRPADPSSGALAEQLEAYTLIRDAVGKDVPIVATVFSPLMVASFMFPDGYADLRNLMIESPRELEEGLAAISETLTEYAGLCHEAGFEGIFYATNLANHGMMTPEQFNRFQRPFDTPILHASKGPFNILHMCGDHILFEELKDYPASVFSWATTSKNPSLSEVHECTQKAVLGGLPGKPSIKSMSEAELLDHGRQSLEEMRGRPHLLGPDCSINPDTPRELIGSISKLFQ
ncbi:uroporphyrinogen decarboxylase family protein [Stappia sp. ES.058]|uniref:uroporphyrinogen decarboxylase family protein n=1 Tax=Stappia sp. ES.058 TaxID=1881061 RepID=UPI00087A69DE|nr:uroporphyrinogen decarboxylase family protein [Stappia sp. ES.058]SDU43248.1 uroporphyrinogen decarboxylase [Stappia sp. ES.058]